MRVSVGSPREEPVTNAILFFKPKSISASVARFTSFHVCRLKRSNIPTCKLSNFFQTISIFCSITSPSGQLDSTHFPTLCRDCLRITESELIMAHPMTVSCQASCKSISATETLNSRRKRAISGLIRPRFSLSEAQPGRWR